jgi:hypothetical protein
VSSVYAFATPSMPGMVKIGATDRDVAERLRDANASDTWRPPEPYTVVCAVRVEDAFATERAIHDGEPRTLASRVLSYIRRRGARRLRALRRTKLSPRCRKRLPTRRVVHSARKQKKKAQRGGKAAEGNETFH